MSINLAQLLVIGQTIAGLLPVVDTTVKGIEAALPAGTPGTVKLEAARQTMSGIFATMEGLAVTFEQAWPALNGVIGALVTAYNAIGIFKKGQTPTAAAG